MPYPPEILRLAQPLKDVVLAGPMSAEQAARDGDARERAGYERGRVDGEKALGEQLVRQRAELLELQNGVLESLRQAVPQVARECEKALIELALTVAQKLIAGVAISAEMVEASVREALEQVRETTDILVHLHTEDLALLKQANSPLLIQGGVFDQIRFQISSDVTRGGCIVQTRFGIIDGRRETKVALIRKSLA